MDFKVIFRDTFIADLEGIIRSVAIHDPEAARRLGDSIVAAGERLSFFPERHPSVRQRPGIRRFITARYFKVFYRVRYASRTVEVLRCWDGRREHDPAP
jgi:plasmid stabilization system protein ParE